MEKKNLKLIIIGFVILFFLVIADFFPATFSFWKEEQKAINIGQIQKKQSLFSGENKQSLFSNENKQSLFSNENKQSLFSNENEKELYLVTRIVDGDTIELENKEKVRYIGIDTPESVNPSKSIECFGKESAIKNKEFVLGKKVRLEKDVLEKDKYGRLLRYVYVGDFFVNLELIKQGYANVFTYPPDVKYASLFLEAEQEARKEQKGLWGKCSTKGLRKINLFNY